MSGKHNPLYMHSVPDFDCCLICKYRREFRAICDHRCDKCRKPADDHIWHDHSCGVFERMSDERIKRELEFGKKSPFIYHAVGGGE